MNSSPHAQAKTPSFAVNRLPESASAKPRLWRVAVVVIWIAASCGGLAALAIYASLPGASQEGPSQWPSETELRLSDQGSTLILFAHPKCPCTRATLGELEKTVARYQGSVTPWVVFYKPLGTDDLWDHTDLRTTAAAIPGVHIVSDVGGVEAERFNATTSGETLLYSDQGELLFQGGITMARGHAGDNAGRSAIECSLSGDVPACRKAPVFGCPISNPSQRTKEAP